MCFLSSKRFGQEVMYVNGRVRRISLRGRADLDIFMPNMVSISSYGSTNFCIFSSRNYAKVHCGYVNYRRNMVILGGSTWETSRVN